MSFVVSLFSAICFLLPGLTHAADFSSGDPVKGKAIYDHICVHCHKLTDEKSLVGAPGFKGVTKRRSLEWINEWIQGPEAFAKKDADAKKLIESNKTGLIMPTLPEMQKEQNRMDIIAFLKTL